MTRRPAWYTAEDARADRAARYGVTSTSTGDRPNYARPAGVLAWFDGTCPRCDQPIIGNADQVIERKQSWIHSRCASGADDE